MNCLTGLRWQILIYKQNTLFGRKLVAVQKDVRGLPGSQALGKSRPCAHRQHNFQATLYLHRRMLVGLFANSDNKTIRRKPHRLYPY